jgi:hypothetical protein
MEKTVGSDLSGKLRPAGIFFKECPAEKKIFQTFDNEKEDVNIISIISSDGIMNYSGRRRPSWEDQ